MLGFHVGVIKSGKNIVIYKSVKLDPENKADELNKTTQKNIKLCALTHRLLNASDLSC